MSTTPSLNSIKQQFEQNPQLKRMALIFGAVVLIIVGYLLYLQFIVKPDSEKSKEAYYYGLNLASKDSTDAAIAQLEPVVKKYDGHVGGEIAQFTLARQYMTKGNYKKALDLLEDVDVSDTYVAVHAIGLQGDCNSELGKYKEAMALYEEAAAKNENEYTSPMYLFKAGMVAEELKDYEKATALYEQIRDNYVTFSSQKQIEKYIARVSNFKKK